MDRLLRCQSISTLLLVVTLPICSNPAFRISGKVHACLLYVLAWLECSFNHMSTRALLGGSHVTGIDSMSIS